MRKNSDLFELIKSLNKNEKRYFRLYAAIQAGSKNYIKLFNAIDKMTVYDESILIKKYKKEKFIKQLAYTKNYLYEQVMKSLSQFNNEKSTDNKIQLMISGCRILFKKTLFRQYFEAIKKAKKFALKHERFGYYLQLLDMEKVIIKKEEIQTEKYTSIHSEALAALDMMRSIFDYSYLSGKVLVNFREYGTARGEKQEKEINEIISNPLSKDVNNAKCERARESFYRLHELISNTRADYTKSLEALEMRHKIVTANPLPFKDYIIDFNNDIIFSTINTCLRFNKLDEAEHCMNTYYDTLTKNKSDVSDFEISSRYINFQILIKKGEIKKAVKLIPPLYELLNMYRNKILMDIELGILFNIVKCRILEKNYTAALKAVNELLAHPFLDKRADYESYSRILNLVIHYELGNFELLKYLLVSVYRYLYKREKKYRLETVLLDFIRKISEVKNDDMLKFSLTSLKKQLEILKNDEYEKNAFEYFDFLEWVAGKI